MLGGDEAAGGKQSEQPAFGRAGSGGSGSRKQSPNVAEKAAAHMAALLPAGFRPKETVNEFLSEVRLSEMLDVDYSCLKWLKCNTLSLSFSLSQGCFC